MRVKEVQRARKAQGKCGRCGDAIKVGDSYRFWAFRYGGRRVRCMKSTCNPRQSELTQNDVLSEAYSITEEYIDIADSYDEFKDQVNDFVERIRAIGEETIQEKMDNIESGFGHTDIPAYADLEEQQGSVEGWADEVEAVTNDYNEDDFDAEDARDALTDAVGNCPL